MAETKQNKNAIPSGYKMTEIGVIPEDWEIIALENLLLYEQPQKYISNELLKLGPIPVLTPGKSFILGYCTESNNTYISLPAILFDDFTTASQWVDFPFKVRSSAVKMLRPKTESYNFRLIFEMMSLITFDTSDHKRFWISEYSKIKIPIPKKREEQDIIATALSDTDRYIEQLEAIIEKKEQIKTGAMQQLLTGKTRLPQFANHPDGTPKGMKMSELGEIPEDWELITLGEILCYEQPQKYITDDLLASGEIPVLTPGKSFLLGYCNDTENVYDTIPTILFDDFTTASQWVSFPFKVRSSAVKMLKPKNYDHNFRLIYEIMSLINFNISDHKRFWISEYSQLNIALPPTLNEQTSIATILSDMDQEITQLKEKLQKARDLKEGMMQNLLTGKIRLI